MFQRKYAFHLYKDQISQGVSKSRDVRRPFTDNAQSEPDPEKRQRQEQNLEPVWQGAAEGQGPGRRLSQGPLPKSKPGQLMLQEKSQEAGGAVEDERTSLTPADIKIAIKGLESSSERAAMRRWRNGRAARAPAQDRGQHCGQLPSALQEQRPHLPGHPRVLSTPARAPEPDRKLTGGVTGKRSRQT